MEATCLMVLLHLKGECQAHRYILSPCLIGLTNPQGLLIMNAREDSYPFPAKAYNRWCKCISLGFRLFSYEENVVGAFVMMDVANISGLVAASAVADPFEYCDVVTTTTHKPCEVLEVV